MFPNNNKTLKRNILCNLNCILCIFFVNILSININFVQVSLQRLVFCISALSIIWISMVTSSHHPLSLIEIILLNCCLGLHLWFCSSLLLMMCRKWRGIFERISSLCLVSSLYPLSSSAIHKRTRILKWPVIISVQSLSWIRYFCYSSYPSVLLMVISVQLWTIFQVFNPWSATTNAMYLNLWTVSSSLLLLTQQMSIKSN